MSVVVSVTMVFPQQTLQVPMSCHESFFIFEVRMMVILPVTFTVSQEMLITGFLVIISLNHCASIIGRCPYQPSIITHEETEAGTWSQLPRESGIRAWPRNHQLLTCLPYSVVYKMPSLLITAFTKDGDWHFASKCWWTETTEVFPVQTMTETESLQ